MSVKIVLFQLIPVVVFSLIIIRLILVLHTLLKDFYKLVQQNHELFCLGLVRDHVQLVREWLCCVLVLFACPVVEFGLAVDG
jgi:hypothetical protein